MFDSRYPVSAPDKFTYEFLNQCSLAAVLFTYDTYYRGHGICLSFRFTNLVANIPISYSPIIGTARSIRLTTSPVGVIIAAAMKHTRTAYFLLRVKKSVVTMPSIVKRYIKIGNSKIAPHPNIIIEVNERYLLTVIIGSNSTEPKFKRYGIAKGSITKYANAHPIKNEMVVHKINRLACLLSLG